MVVDQSLLLLVSHVAQRVVFPRQVTGQASQSLGDYLLHHPAFGPRAGRRQAEAADATAGTDPGRQDVLGVEVATSYLGGVQVCRVDVIDPVAVVSLVDHGVEQLLEDLGILKKRLKIVQISGRIFVNIVIDVLVF